jgi:hypothetical protein
LQNDVKQVSAIERGANGINLELDKPRDQRLNVLRLSGVAKEEVWDKQSIHSTSSQITGSAASQ